MALTAEPTEDGTESPPCFIRAGVNPNNRLEICARGDAGNSLVHAEPTEGCGLHTFGCCSRCRHWCRHWCLWCHGCSCRNGSRSRLTLPPFCLLYTLHISFGHILETTTPVPSHPDSPSPLSLSFFCIFSPPPPASLL